MSLRAVSLTWLLLWTVTPASAQERADYEDGCGRLVEVLALIAARDGAEAARQLTGPELPGYLDRALGQLQDVPEAVDLRGFARLRLQASLVPRLLATDDVSVANDRFTRDTSGRLEGALATLERDVVRLRDAAQALQRKASRNAVSSRLAVPAHPAGEELLLLAAGAPLWLARLAEPAHGSQTYTLLADLLDHERDPLVGFGLDLLRRTPELAARELAALDRGGAVVSANRRLDARLTRTARALREALETSVLAVTAIRDEELARVVAGGRSPDLQPAVRLYAAYKAEFGVPPDLEATRWLDVYAQRGSGQLFFWAEEEGLWVAGGEPAHPLEPVLEALAGSGLASLRAQLGNARALGGFYTLFHEGDDPQSFSAGLEALLALARATASHWEQASEVLRSIGHPALEAAPRGLALELGYTPFSGPGAADAARDQLLLAALTGGPAQAQDFQRAVAQTAARWADQRLVAVRVDLQLPAEARANLCWTPALTDPRWLVQPLTHAPSGEIAGVLRLGADEQPPPLSVEAGARHDGAYLGGSARPQPGGEPTPLVMEPARGPRLVLGDGGTRVEQLPHEDRLLHVWLETPTGARLLRPTAHGAWLDLDPRDPARKGRLLGRDARGRLKAPPVKIALPARPAVVLGEGDAALWHVEPGQVLQARVLAQGQPLPGPHTFEVRDAGGALIHRAEGASLSWSAGSPPGRYQVAVAGARSTWFAISSGRPHVVAAAGPWTDALSSVAPGQGCLLRLDAWPWLEATEITHVEWSWRGGEEERRATTYALPGQPQTALRLPLTLDPGAAPGPRQVTARAFTTRGPLTIEGQLQVESGQTVELELLDEDVQPLASLVRGGLGLLRAGVKLRRADWVLLDPAGRPRRLRVGPDGLARLALDPDALWGRYQVWLSGETRAEGARVHGRLEVQITRGRPGSERGVPLTGLTAQAQGARAGSLSPVRVQATGTELGLVEAPGPLGLLSLRAEWAASLGDGPARVRLFLVGEPRPPHAGLELPGVWSSMSGRAQLCLEASLQLEIDGRLVQLGTVRRVESGGVDLTLDLVLDGQRTVLHTLHGQEHPSSLDSRLRRAHRVELVVRARLRPALPPSVWPPGRDRPTPLEVDGVGWCLDPDLLPQTSVELRARWAHAEPATERAIGDLTAAAPRRLDAAVEIRAAETALAADRPAAAAIHARRAVLLTDDPRAWTALAEVALQRRRPAEALELASRALEAGDHPRAWIVAGEAALGTSRLEEARRAAAAAGAGLSPGSDLEARLQRLERKLR